MDSLPNVSLNSQYDIQLLQTPQLGVCLCFTSELNLDGINVSL